MMTRSLVFFASLACLEFALAGPTIDIVSTSRDGSLKMAVQPSSEFFPSTLSAPSSSSPFNITVDTSVQYQSVYGIGSSLEGSTCYNLMQLTPEARATVLSNLLDPNSGIGMSLMRLTVGSSDFNPLPFYSYDDSVSPDAALSSFSVAADNAYMLPAIKGALPYTAGEDGVRFFASVWSPPAWMKSSNSLQGGRFLSEFSATYSRYIVKFLKAYAEEGIDVSAVTVQNEPLQNDDSYPTTLLLPEQEAKIVGQHLGPLLETEGMLNDTQIWAFDHNWDDHYYPKHVLSDADAYKYVSGTAYHHYGGRPSEMSSFHSQFPAKDIFFSEGSAFGLRGAAEIVDIFNNYARTYSAWVTMLDSDLQPNAGPFKPNPTMLELDAVTKEVTYRFEYYMYGQFSKYVRRGAKRVLSVRGDGSGGSDGERGEPSFVSFVNPDDEAVGAANQNKIVLVVVNPGEGASVRVLWNGLQADVTLPGESITTLRWDGA